MGRWNLKRGIASAGVVGVVAITAAGCGSSSSSGGSSSGGSGSSSTVVVGDTSSVQKLNPAVMTNFLDFQAVGMIYQTLVTLNKSLQVEPELATSWQVGDGGKSVTFDLRHGVKFDDGSPFTSADVKASLAYIVKPSTGAAAASYLASIESVSAPSAYTVVLHLKQPDSSLLYGLTSQNIAMMSAKSIAAGTLASKPDGTGPYEYSSYSQNNSFTVVRDSSYWGPRPHIAKIEFRTISDEQSIAAALEAGTVQLGLLTEPQVVQQLTGGSADVEKQLDLNYRALMIQSKGPFANVDNRLALQCAINRRDVLQAAVMGGGRVVGPVPAGPFASDPTSGVCASQNLTLAKQYLAKAGNPSGFKFTLLTSEELDGTSNAQAVTIQNELQKVGITASIDNVAGSQYIQQWLKGDFQGVLAENGANPSPYIMYGRYFGKGASLAVPAGYSSPTLQKLLASADATSSTDTQRQLYTQFSDELVNNAVWVWLFNAYDYYAKSPKLQGFSAMPSGSLINLATATVS